MNFQTKILYSLILTSSCLQYCMEYELEESIRPHAIIIHYDDWKRYQRETYVKNAISIATIKEAVAHQEKSWYMNEMIETVERNIAFHEKKHIAAILANIEALKKAPSQS